MLENSLCAINRALLDWVGHLSSRNGQCNSMVMVLLDWDFEQNLGLVSFLPFIFLGDDRWIGNFNGVGLLVALFICHSSNMLSLYRLFPSSFKQLSRSGLGLKRTKSNLNRILMVENCKLLLPVFLYRRGEMASTEGSGQQGPPQQQSVPQQVTTSVSNVQLTQSQVQQQQPTPSPQQQIQLQQANVATAQSLHGAQQQHQANQNQQQQMQQLLISSSPQQYNLQNLQQLLGQQIIMQPGNFLNSNMNSPIQVRRALCSLSFIKKE